MPIREVVGMPKQQPPKKQPILPNAWASINDGVTRLNVDRQLSLNIRQRTKNVITPKINPP
jgi:hypothetical protein